jgi:hypothetical protein
MTLNQTIGYIYLNYHFKISKRYLQDLCKLGIIDAEKIAGAWHVRKPFSIDQQISSNWENKYAKN